jgi:hypothetical protein
MYAASCACIAWSKGLGATLLRSTGAEALGAAVGAGTAAVGAGTMVALSVAVAARALVGVPAAGLALGALPHAARMDTSSRAATAAASQRERFIFIIVFLFDTILK